MIRMLLLILSLLLGTGALAREPGPSARAATALEAADAEIDPPPLPTGWRSQPGPFATVYSAPRDETTALRLARHATEAVPRLGEALALPVGRPIEIFLAQNDAEFEAMQPGKVPEWADGTAWPRRGLIYLHSPRGRSGTGESLEQVLDHEIVHILLGRAFGDRPVPTWVQEGLAQLYAGENRPDRIDRIASGVLGGSLLTLEELARGFPADPIRAQLAYAQSADLVTWIRGTYGEDALQVVIHQMAAGRPVAAALREGTGQSIQDLDKAWRARLSSSPLWLKPLVSDSMIFSVVGVIFLIGAGRIRRRNKERLRRWEREEALRDALSEAALRSWARPKEEETSEEAPPQWAWGGQEPDRWLH